MSGLPANRLMIRDRFRAIVWIGGLLLLALVGLAFARAAAGAPPAPARLPALIWVHVATVLPAVPLGMWLFLHPKGTPAHRWLGRVWMALMVATAATTFGVRTINDGRLSFIHLFSAYVLIATPLAWRAAARRQLRVHSRIVQGVFAGGLIVAGLATFVPGRIMWAWAFHGW